MILYIIILNIVIIVLTCFNAMIGGFRCFRMFPGVLTRCFRCLSLHGRAFQPCHCCSRYRVDFFMRPGSRGKVSADNNL